MWTVNRSYFSFIGLGVVAVGLFLFIFGSGATAVAQTLATGEINGVVTDSTGAVVPNATVAIIDIESGATRSATTNGTGHFRVPYLIPSRYTVSATAPGMQSNTTSVQVFLGQQSFAKITLVPHGSTQKVTVTANDARLIDMQTANLTTTFTTEQLQDLPAPGGDITTIAYTVPGVVVGAGGGNSFSSNGMSGSSNLVLINGMDYNEPFYNGNFAGASGLTLGQQEIAQASVVQNGYSVEYGRQASAILSFATKSGTNRVHGLLVYGYNSNGLNANGFFNNLYHSPKNKAVSNQYAAQIGGPIKHDKLFFFVDTEGIRYSSPGSGYLNSLTSALQNTILNTVSPSSAILYGTMFKLMQSAPSYSTAQPITNGTGGLQDATGRLGCGSIAGTPVYGQPNTYFGTVPANSAGIAIPCMNTAYARSVANVQEWLATGRLDWNVSEKHRMFFRVTDDQSSVNSGSVISPLMDTVEPFPSYTGQMNDAYTISPRMVNQFILSGFYYSFILGPPNLAETLAASPAYLGEGTDGGSNSSVGFNLGYPWFGYPQGLANFQYQFSDDLSISKGNHNIKVGLNYKRYDLDNYGNQAFLFAGFYSFGDFADLTGGVLPGHAASNYQQRYTTNPTMYTAYDNFGIFAQDEWQALPNLILDYGLRVDHNADPRCNNNCFDYYNNGSFPASGASLDTPYNASVSIGKRYAYPSIEKAIFQPRGGFNWDVSGGRGKTILRGGVGLFADLDAGFQAASIYYTFPTVFTPVISAGLVAQGPGSAPAIGAESFAALTNGFAAGENTNQLAASLPAGVPFAAPFLYTTAPEYHAPRFLEWSLQLEHQIAPSDAIILSYVGNHGYNMLMQNNHINQNLGGTTLANGNVLFYPSGYTSFGGLPTASPDPRFGNAIITNTTAISNYNRLSITYKHIDHRGLIADITYNYSHALDEISNGGAGGSWNSEEGNQLQITPNSTSALMYSNADYDYRNNLVLDVTYVEPNHFANKFLDLAAGGWTVAGKAYWRTGEPFSVVNTNASNRLYNGTGSVEVLADVLNNHFNHTCNSFEHRCLQTPGIFNGSASQDNFGNVPRNAFYGAHYADVDLSVYKALLHLRSTTFQVGMQAYNALNHANFGLPGSNASSPGSLGLMTGTLVSPTSPYGAFGAVPGRAVVVQGRLIF